jgi:hypothetical protein
MQKYEHMTVKYHAGAFSSFGNSCAYHGVINVSAFKISEVSFAFFSVDDGHINGVQLLW